MAGGMFVVGSMALSSQVVEPVDAAAIAQIRDQGLNHSQVGESLFWLADVHGPRLTGSPAMEAAGDWAVETLTGLGLENVRKERFTFGPGWAVKRFDLAMVEPQVMPIIGVPHAWSAGTSGRVSAEVVRPDIRSSADAQAWRGRLDRRIVLLQPEREVRLLDGRVVLRMTDEEITEARAEPPPPPAGAGRAVGGRGGAAGRGTAGRGAATGGPPPEPFDLLAFYRTEGVVALFDRGSNNDTSAGGSGLSWQTQRVDGGTVFAGTGQPTSEAEAALNLPRVTLAVEHYNRLARLVDRDVPVRVELDLAVEFYPEAEPNAFNVIGDRPGTDLADEIVLIGAHLDTWQGSPGATDNSAGVAAMIEVLRILHDARLQPRRTIRIALWGAEEQGLLGSREYARRYLGTPANPGPEQARHSVYFNLDNGAGPVRGIWLEGHRAVAPIFEAWMRPLADLGVEILGPRVVGATDHASLNRAGVPGFQFMQERLEYNSRSHHSNMDFADRVQIEYLRQVATVATVFTWQAATRDGMMPRD